MPQKIPKEKKLQIIAIKPIIDIGKKRKETGFMRSSGTLGFV
tara:strand:- start:226 stop:351 length:126 start_codon:yes stop_codon:yes gene_type:complete